MFKLAAFTDEIAQDFEHALAVCKEYDLEAAEIRSVWGKRPHQLNNAEDIGKMKKALEKARMKCCCIASPFFKCELGDKEQYQAHVNILRDCIALGKALGTNIVRGFTFWKRGEPEPVWAQILENFVEPVKIVEGEGVTLAIENEPSVYGATAALVERFIKEVDSPNVKAVWDPANEVHSREETAYPDAYLRLRPFMVHMHLKDAAWDEAEGKVKGCCLGDGEVNLPGQFRALIQDGYEGYVSLETHWRTEALSEEQLKQPGGAEFSSTAERASRICLERLRAILDAL